MKIVVLSGSPRKGANTDTMVEAFAETAREGGNTVEVVRVASKKIAGCLNWKKRICPRFLCRKREQPYNFINGNTSPNAGEVFFMQTKAFLLFDD